MSMTMVLILIVPLVLIFLLVLVLSPFLLPFILLFRTFGYEMSNLATLITWPLLVSSLLIVVLIFICGFESHSLTCTNNVWHDGIWHSFGGLDCRLICHLMFLKLSKKRMRLHLIIIIPVSNHLGKSHVLHLASSKKPSCDLVIIPIFTTKGSHLVDNYHKPIK